MHIIIVGCGRVGASVATFLADEGHDVVVVDKDPAAFDNLGGTFNGLVVTGTGIDEDVLKRAGIERADAFAAVTNNDDVNIMAAQVARDVLGVERVVARANDPRREFVFSELGITTICPTNLGASSIRSMLLLKGIQPRQALGAGEVLLADMVVGEENANRTVAEMEIAGKVRACAVIRRGTALVPEGDFACRPDDILVVSARLDAFETLRGLLERSVREKPTPFWKFGHRGEMR